MIEESAFNWPSEWCAAWRKEIKEFSLTYLDVEEDEHWIIDGQIAAVGMGWA